MYRSAYSETEQAEQEYIEAYGEGGIATIVMAWLDKPRPDLTEKQYEDLTAGISAVLKAHLSDLEQAEWAAITVGNPDFDTFLGDKLCRL